MTPILVLGFGIKPGVAVGTDLLYAAITKSGGIFVHHKHGNIQWRIVSLLSIGSIPTSLIALLYLKHLYSQGVDYDHMIMSTLSVALILTAIFLLTRDYLQSVSKHESFRLIKLAHERYRKHVTIFAGIMIGLLVTVSSVGAGVIGAAILFFLYPELKTIKIAATDLAHAVPITAIAGLGHAHIGTVNYVLLGSLLIGSLPGIYLGSHFGTILPEKIMRPLLATLLLLIGMKLAV